MIRGRITPGKSGRHLDLQGALQFPPQRDSHHAINAQISNCSAPSTSSAPPSISTLTMMSLIRASSHVLSSGPLDGMLPATPSSYLRSIVQLPDSVQQSEMAVNKSRTFLLSQFEESKASRESLIVLDENGIWYKCLLERNWHPNPASIDSSDCASILMVRPELKRASEFTQGVVDFGLCCEEGILTTHRLDASGNAGQILTAHRHICLVEGSPLQQ